MAFKSEYIWKSTMTSLRKSVSLHFQKQMRNYIRQHQDS